MCLSLHRQTKKDGAIAQLVEQRTENPCVPRSIRGGTTENQAVITRVVTAFILSIEKAPNLILHRLSLFSR